MAKRLLCLLLVAATLLLSCACTKETGGADVCKAFLTYMENGEYDKAYALLSAKSRNDTEESKVNRITEKEFEEKHKSIYEALQIKSVEFYDIEINDGEIMTTATYGAVYHSSWLGDINDEFSLVVMREGGEWRIEWSPSLIFSDMEWGDTVRIASISAKRGEIMADNELLASTVGVITVYAMPSEIEDAAAFTTQVSRLLGMTEEKVTKALEKEISNFALLKQFHTDELTEAVKEQLSQIPGIGIDYGTYGTQREYPNGDMLSHIIGYVGHIPAPSVDELKKTLEEYNKDRTERDGLYTSDSIVGRLGLEKQFEKELRGNDGTMVYIRTADGIVRRTIYREEAENGFDIELTLDMDLQRRLDEVMELVLFGETTAGAVIVMNPNTGEIKAMTSYPSYDLNEFTRGISSDSYQKLLDDQRTPLYNRLTQGLYPPGSVMKAFTAAAALDTGTLNEEFVFDDSQIKDDYWVPTEFGTWIWPAIKRTSMNNRTRPLNMFNAILTSDNIFFAYTALMLGEENFLNYMSNIGFDEAIPFDLAIASPQLVNEETDITYKLLADSGYGQGEILVTPLQLASMFCALANGGDVPVPRIVEGVYREEGIKLSPVTESETTFFRQGVISRETIDKELPMLKAVVDRDNYNGTGRQLKVRDVTIAAKTGTAEIGDDKSREISWFAGFRCDVSDDDARLVLVMLEIPASSEFSSLKFDIAREMLKMGNEAET